MKQPIDIDQEKLAGLIRFKEVPTDADRVYRRLWNWIEAGEAPKLRPVGVSVVWKYVSIAALALLVAMVSWLALRASEAEPELQAYLEVEAVPGAKVKVVLPDSSVVWLNSLAQIRYPQAFDSDTRQVELKGEALFNVKPDAEKPFVVQAEDLKIKVLGTKFNLYMTDELIEATLLEGSVALFGKANQTETPDVVMKPGEQTLYTKADGKMNVHTVQTGEYTAWLDGQFIFEGKPFHEIVAVLQRAFGMKIHVSGKRLKNKQLTARFTHGETLDDILSILQYSAHYTYVRKGGDIYIYEK